jgi:hypothetical protein
MVADMPTPRVKMELSLPPDLSAKVERMQKETSAKLGHSVSRNSVLIGIVRYFFLVCPPEEGLQKEEVAVEEDPVQQRE